MTDNDGLNAYRQRVASETTAEMRGLMTEDERNQGVGELAAALIADHEILRVVMERLSLDEVASVASYMGGRFPGHVALTLAAQCPGLVTDVIDGR